ncbi:MAG: hypothetical protein PVG78_03070 [Desulfobacterales bacterium]|jgi:hypothetical protein
MDVLIDIVLAATELFTLIIGLVGCCLSILLLFYPEAVRRLGDKLNKNLSLIRISPILDRKVEVNRLAYRHPLLVGSFFVIGSVFVLQFLYLKLSLPVEQPFFESLCLEAMTWIAKAASFCGILLGIALIWRPNKVRSLEDRLGAWIDTQPFFSGLDRAHPQIDHLFLRHPRISGAAGLLASFVLTVLSLYNLSR